MNVQSALVYLFWLFLMSSGNLNGQNLSLDLDDGSTVFYPLEDIENIRFSMSEMSIDLMDNTTDTWGIDSISRYSYPSLITDLLEEEIPLRSVRVYPNPSSSEVTIEYQMDESGKVNIDIFNINGSLVKQLASGIRKKGKHRTVWSIHNSSTVTSGTYLCRMIVEGKEVFNKIVVTK